MLIGSARNVLERAGRGPAGGKSSRVASRALPRAQHVGLNFRRADADSEVVRAGTGARHGAPQEGLVKTKTKTTSAGRQRIVQFLGRGRAPHEAG